MRWMSRPWRRTVGIAVVAASALLSVIGGMNVGDAASTTAEPEPAASVTVVPAGVDDFEFLSLDVDYTLGRRDDGTSTLRVVETFTAQFPEFDQNRGMRRTIPDSYNGQPLHPALISITDGTGAPRPQETESDDGAYSMTSRASGFVHGTQVYVFTYDLENVTWDFPDTGQEFYWDVNGTDWAQPFGAVTARVHLDDDLAEAMTGGRACYAGYQGATTTCPISSAPDGSGAVVTAGPAVLLPRQTMTIAIGFAPGTFALFDSAYFASGWSWAQVAGGIGLLGALGWGIAARRRLRDDAGRPTIIAEYTPPPGMDALESAVLLGKTSKAIPAEVLEQAIVGSIRIVEKPARRFGKPKLQAVLIDRSLADGDGRMLLNGLFPDGAAPGAVYEFGRQDTRFSSQAQRILKAAVKELQRRGLRRAVPPGTRAWPIVAAVGVAMLVWLFGAMALSAFVDPPVPILLMIAATITVIIVIALVSRTPLTARGAEVRDHLKGLKVFIDWAEADRIRMLQSVAGAERAPLHPRVDPADPRQMIRLYENLLPYAVVFGQERSWAAQLAVLYAGSTPYWYYGTSGFDASAFSSGIATLSASASSSSSTSGGSSGGGSAGGGGGGGGGGGV